MVINFPLVSIITPAYNRADYLDETIQSILNQDYANVEYVVLDDGSKDHTREVLEKYTGKILWESHPNMGEVRTVNKGMAMAHGDLVAVVNSDDPLLPGAIKTAVNLMQDHPEVLVAYPDWIKIGPAGERISQVQVAEYDYAYTLRYHHCIVGPGAFARRRAVELIGFRDPAFRYVADFDYWLRLGLHGPFMRIPQSLATFRVHPDSLSVSSKGKAMADEHIRLMEKFFGLPNLPTDVRRLRSQALGSAHRVAADACGSARGAARWHLAQAAWYYPRYLPAMLLAILPTSISGALLPIARRLALRGRVKTPVRGSEVFLH